MENWIIKRVLLVAVTACGIQLAIYATRKKAGDEFAIEFETSSSQGIPASIYSYRFTFGERLKSESPAMVRHVNDSVEKFLKGARGKRSSQVDARYLGSPIISPIGVSEAKSYVVTMEMTYHSADDFYSDLNLSQKLGAIGQLLRAEDILDFGRGSSEAFTVNSPTASINDEQRDTSSKELGKINLETIRKQSEIYKASLNLEIIECDGTQQVYIPAGDPMFGGGQSSSSETTFGESGTKTTPPASRYKIPLSKLVIEPKVKPDPNLDITFPKSLWPNVTTWITTKKTVCFRPV